MTRRGLKNDGAVVPVDTFQHSSGSEINTVKEPVWLDIQSQADIQTAVDYLVSGDAPLFLPFGNIIGAFSNPSEQAVGDLNELKGRKREQPGSVTTVSQHYEGLADWENLDDVLTKTKVLDIIGHLSKLGPIGFLLPAIDGIPTHLSKTADINGRSLKTVQLIVPGDESPVNAIFQSAASQMPDNPYLFATSANMSKAVTKTEQAAHHRFAPLVKEFAQEGRGGLIVVRDDETAMRRRHPFHDSRSTTILDLTGVVRNTKGVALLDRQDRPIVRVSRFGSAHPRLVRNFLEEQGLGVEFPETKIPKRDYSTAEKTLYAFRSVRANIGRNPAHR